MIYIFSAVLLVSNNVYFDLGVRVTALSVTEGTVPATDYNVDIYSLFLFNNGSFENDSTTKKMDNIKTRNGKGNKKRKKNRRKKILKRNEAKQNKFYLFNNFSSVKNNMTKENEDIILQKNGIVHENGKIAETLKSKEAGTKKYKMRHSLVKNFYELEPNSYTTSSPGKISNLFRSEKAVQSNAHLSSKVSTHSSDPHAESSYAFTIPIFEATDMRRFRKITRDAIKVKKNYTITTKFVDSRVNTGRYILLTAVTPHETIATFSKVDDTDYETDKDFETHENLTNGFFNKKYVASESKELTNISAIQAKLGNESFYTIFKDGYIEQKFKHDLDKSFKTDMRHKKASANKNRAVSSDENFSVLYTSGKISDKNIFKLNDYISSDETVSAELKRLSKITLKDGNRNDAKSTFENFSDSEDKANLKTLFKLKDYISSYES